MTHVVVASFDTEVALRCALMSCVLTALAILRPTLRKLLRKMSGISPLPRAIFVAGVFGLCAGFGMQSYADVIGYPLDIRAGRPKFSWPAFVPIAFEIGILFAVLTGVFGYLAVNLMPRLYDPIDECLSLRDAMRDGWVVAIRGDSPREERAREICEIKPGPRRGGAGMRCGFLLLLGFVALGAATI